MDRPRCKTGICCDTENGTVQPNTVECRAAAGFCDVAEKCTGSAAACPTNTFQPSSLVCQNWTEYQCSSTTSCGAAAQQRPVDKYYPGNAASCSGSVVQSGWSTIQNCNLTTQICDTNGTTFAQCNNCLPLEACSSGLCACMYVDCVGNCCASTEICRFNDTCGVEETKFVASDGAFHDLFGYSVSISSDGSYVMVGANYDDDKGSDSGSAYIY